MTESGRRRLLAVVLICLAAGMSAAQEPAAPQESNQEWLTKRTEELASYRFAMDGVKPVELALEGKSLLNWSNAERGTAAGALFLWTRDGQPEMIACAFGRGEWLRHEFHSLSDEPIIAERGGSQVHRFQPGIQWRELADAP